MIIPRSVLNITAIAAKEPSRYAVDAVQFTRDAYHPATPTAHPLCHAATTNGYSAIEVSWCDHAARQSPSHHPEGAGNIIVVPNACFRPLISAKVLNAVKKHIPKRPFRDHLHPTNPVTVVTIDEHSLSNPNADGVHLQAVVSDGSLSNTHQLYIPTEEPGATFPKLDDLFDAAAQNQTVSLCVNARLLSTLLDSIDKVATQDGDSSGAVVELCVPLESPCGATRAKNTTIVINLLGINGDSYTMQPPSVAVRAAIMPIDSPRGSGPAAPACACTCPPEPTK